nr:hypothetical protein [Escherichia coli]
MSDEQHIGNDKSRYINAPKRTEVIHRSGLQGLKGQPRLKKLFTLHNGRKLEAEHIIVPAEKGGTGNHSTPSEPTKSGGSFCKCSKRYSEGH